MPQTVIVIRIEIPALSELVAYLNGLQQGDVDALTAKVAVLTGRLRQSAEALQGAIDKEK